jgi:hypothetical protein
MDRSTLPYSTIKDFRLPTQLPLISDPSEVASRWFAFARWASSWIGSGLSKDNFGPSFQSTR